MRTLTCVKTRETITLTQKLADSGEGSVWITQDPNKLAKLYHQVTPARLEKLETMIVYPPKNPNLAANHITYAWPESLLWDEQGNIIGFLMPRIVGASELIQVYSPSQRQRLKLAIDWSHLHGIAHNFALAVHNLHEEGYVLGDIKAQNILVNDRGLISIIDTDSFQVRHPLSGKLHHCLVGSPDYTPPELLGKDFSTTEQTRAHDRFRIGVIFYQLLFGVHPFADGKWLGGGDPPELRYCLEQGLWPFGWDANLEPGRFTIPLNVLHPNLKACFLECFNEGHFDPSQRPTAERWQAAFNQARQDLVLCRSTESHVYSKHYGHCYWCDRAKQLGTDIFAWAPGLKRKKLPNFPPFAATSIPPKAPSAATPPISPTVNPSPRRSLSRVWILVGIITIVVLRAVWLRRVEPTSSVTQIVQQKTEISEENVEVPQNPEEKQSLLPENTQNPPAPPNTDLAPQNREFEDTSQYDRERIAPPTPRPISTPTRLLSPRRQSDAIASPQYREQNISLSANTSPITLTGEVSAMKTQRYWFLLEQGSILESQIIVGNARLTLFTPKGEIVPAALRVRGFAWDVTETGFYALEVTSRDPSVFGLSLSLRQPVQTPSPLVPSQTPSERNTQSESCQQVIDNTIGKLETGRDINTKVSLRDIPRDSSSHLLDRLNEYSFIMSGQAVESVLSSPEFLIVTATTIIETCESVGIVRFGLAHSGWSISIGLFPDGRIDRFSCIEDDPDYNPRSRLPINREWGTQ